MEIEKGITLDLLDQQNPALSSTSDMPVIETKPDSVPAKPEVKTEEKPAEEAPAAEEKAEESAPSETPEDPSAEPEPKKAKGVQKRIDELTRQREDERRRAEAAEARLDRALAALERSGGVSAKDAKQAINIEDPEPQKPARDPDNPESYDAALEQYVSDRASWIARREVKASLAEEERRRTEETQAEQSRRIQDTYRQRVEKAREKYPDFAEVAESPDVNISVVMASAIAHSEEGTDIQYYLGKNPAEATRISQLVPQLQLLELGKIALKLNQPAEKPKPVSAAPAPGKPIKPTSEVTVSLEDASMEEYATIRKQQEAARNPYRVRH